MRFRFTFITGMALLFMIGALYLAFADVEGFVSKRFFFSMVGILGWFIGNKLVELDERLADIEKALAAPNSISVPAEPDAAADARDARNNRFHEPGGKAGSCGDGIFARVFH